MRSCSRLLSVERSQPWLGTFVSIRVDGLPEDAANHAVDAAFREIATVHHRMSFHQADSDVSRLNRAGHSKPIEVHPYTYETLRWALSIAEQSSGCFDVAIGSELVDRKLLPRPDSSISHAGGSWADIELLDGCRVRFRRPLWIDLGGIAKGFAVDVATDRLQAAGAQSAVVNAGGDVRVYGDRTEPIALELESPQNPAPVLEIGEGSLASSSGHRTGSGTHLHGRTRHPASTHRFVSVLAPLCVAADALTKVVMAEGCASAEVLCQFEAAAYFHDPEAGWQHLNPKPI